MKLLLSILMFFLPTSCKKNTLATPPISSTSSPSIKIEKAFSALSFDRPVDLQSPADNSNRIFVVEQKGIISVFDNKTLVSLKNVFLNIDAKVDDSSNEQGLLGLAFHPDYKHNGYFYVNYTNSNSETIISRFKVSSSDQNKADAGSEKILLRFNQPYDNHNGGQIAFGSDGFLYIATGDGGSGGDPKENGQNYNTLLGKILRIDINHESTGKPYAIPTDNPFINPSNARAEIYALGLRNPWRMAFDKETNRLWVADVGQNAYEEINIVEKGKNYGWNKREGNHAYKGGQNQADFVAPVVEIDQNTGDKSITGGYVYRGKNAPSLAGKYIFGDFVSGRIYSVSEETNGKFNHKELFDLPLSIASFGMDEARELYICAFDGFIYKFVENQ